MLCLFLIVDKLGHSPKSNWNLLTLRLCSISAQWERFFWRLAKLSST